MIPNFLVLAGAAFIPFLVAFVWFHPKVFGGTTWAEVAGLTAAQSSTPPKPVKLLLSIFLNFLMAFGIYDIAVHPAGVFGMVSANVEALKTGTAAAFLAEYGANHLSLGHGMFHGIFPGLLCFVLPIIGYAVIFERKSAKYLFINLGFWLVSMILMGGVICKWGWTLV